MFETVLFSARLRLPFPPPPQHLSAAHSTTTTYSVDDPEEYFADCCERVLTECGLWHIRDSPVGSVESGGISSGERKRLMLAVELVGVLRRQQWGGVI